MTGGSAGEHRHVVGVYGRDEELVSAVVDFFCEGFAQDSSAVVIATPGHRAALDAAFASNPCAVDAVLRGRYRSLDAAGTLATFMGGDRPDPVKFATVIGRVVDEAEQTGSPVYLFGEMVGLLWDQGNLAGAVDLESLWNELAGEHAFALFCGYAMSSLETQGDLAAAKRMCDQHSSVIRLDDQSPDGDAASSVSTPDTYDRLFLASPSSVRSVRDFVRKVLRIWGDEEIDSEAEVIASELATNAVKHAESPFRVSLARGRSALRIAVRDTSFDQPEQMRVDTDRAGGRGIQLVSVLASAWGTEPEADGKTVWAEVARA